MLTKLNKSICCGNIGIIKLTRGMTCLVDSDDFEELAKFDWIVKKSFSRWYAARAYYYRGKKHWCFMHRMIMNTPASQITHHKNRRTMDNRKINLANMDQKHHQYLHTLKFPGRLLVKKI